MPKTRARAAAAAKVTEPEMPAEPEEQVELDGSEEMEEDVEYEEIEEEVEELEEEEEEVIEEEEEVEGIEEESDNVATNGAPAKANVTLAKKDPVKEDGKDVEDESKKHTELLALPPHGSEVYVGGIPPDATEDDLRSFCESAGEVTEVRMMKGKDSSENKGYVFVTFRTKELAATAIEKLNNSEFKSISKMEKRRPSHEVPAIKWRS